MAFWSSYEVQEAYEAVVREHPPRGTFDAERALQLIDAYCREAQKRLETPREPGEEG
jgi:hypothetical protein